MSAARAKRSAAAPLVALAVALVMAACGCQGGERTAPPRPPSPEESATSARVLAVKIDNVGPARPQTGLDHADIVYLEQVEAGLSRILAVYSSRLPAVVGPVRSARETDLELLRQFDRPTLAYSGAQGKLTPLIDAARLDALPPSKAPDAYFRSSDRAAPHNLYLRAARTPNATAGANAAADIGLRFGPAPAGGKAVTEHTVRYPSARFVFTWSADRQRWLVAMDGAPARTAEGERLGAATVVVQSVTVRPSLFRDRSGNTSPYTETVGSGTALVLREGRAYETVWSRATAQSDTAFTTPDGKPMTFAAGQVWIVYESR
ncbi:DUF3048 domain-containing protein [Streptomyces sp. NBC_01142]|uniref:DUF3048 domain-containing protein n=1 Tax=Streptomyces sp. NBC_01142 TaxID=2975865 RepID=UPI0022504D2B|nr:DUF3048 domain-containing protein [Streptomyces sp. NBC_01142]MCX4825374.1 DUF3048 domain-containing protein [Streptomyces sp. NBC_01142]